MEPEPPKTLLYRRANFVTHLPADFLYTSSHSWIVKVDSGQRADNLVRPAELWRVGLTKFATRMLGEMVEHAFEVEPDAQVQVGQIIGWVEGFKAISDLFCIAQGIFARSNPALKEKISLINQDPYAAGWLYEVRGEADPNCVDVYGYRDLLDKTIDRLLAQQERQPQ